MDKTLQVITAIGSIVAALTALGAVFWGPKKAADVAQQQIKADADVARQRISADADVARQHIRADLVSKNRQDWINTLRETIAEFLAIILVEQLRMEQKQEGHTDELTQKLMMSKARAQLLINPAEDDHRALVTELGNAILACGKPSKDADSGQHLTGMHAVMTVCDRIVAVAQKILKREWERVKAGE